MKTLSLSALLTVTLAWTPPGTAHAQAPRPVCAAPPAVVVRKPSFTPTTRVKTATATAEARVTVVTPPKELTTLPPFIPGWKELFIRQATLRDEFSAYLKTADLLGYGPFGLGLFDLTNQSAAPGRLRGVRNGGAYGTRMSSRYSRTTSYGGATDYGTSLQDYVDLYGSIDANIAFQQSHLLGKAMIEAAREGTSLHSGNLSELIAGANRVAETNARAAAVERAFKATLPGASSTTESRSTDTGVAPLPAPAPAPAPRPAEAAPRRMAPAPEDTSNLDRVFMAVYAMPACASCHGAAAKNDEARKAFALEGLPSLNEEDRMVVLSAVMATDEKRGMPRGSDGKHSPLSAAVKKKWALYLSR